MLISVDNAVDEMILAKDIYNNSGVILLRKGAHLKKNYIESLKEKGIKTIYIKDESLQDNNIQKIVKEKTRKEALNIVEETIRRLPFSQDKNIKQITYVVEKIVDELLDGEDIFMNLLDIKAVDDYTFDHCVDVCVLSIILGKNLNYSRDDLIELGKGAILHDIGKILVPQRILKKPGRLTYDEFEEMKNHTIYGYKILQTVPEMSESSIDIALSHHERYDGKGYPNGLKGEDIPEYSRIVSVADVYNALTSERVYRKKGKNQEAIEYLTTMKESKFDSHIVDVFVEKIAMYSLNRNVVLNTGVKGVVVDINKNFPSRPVVEIQYDESGQKLLRPYHLNLLENNSIIIDDTLN